MNDIPRQKLQESITQSGFIVYDDPNHCEALLRDLCPEYEREINVLIGALKENVAIDLVNIPDDTSFDVLLVKLAQRLYDNLGITEEIAKWAVESWAVALGVIESAMPQSPAPEIQSTTVPESAAAPKRTIIIRSPEHKAAANRQWWKQWDDNWKSIFKNAINCDREPNDHELVEILNLSELDCSGFKITHLEPLKRLTKLQTLDCRQTEISSLMPLRHLTGLKTLHWDITQVSFEDIKRFVTKCPQCDVGVTLADIKWWLKLDDQWKLVFKDIVHIDGEPNDSQLAKIVNLQNLNLSIYEVKFRSLEPLRHLTNLHTFNCNMAQVTSKEVEKFIS